MLHVPPAAQVLGLKACVTTAQLAVNILKEKLREP